MAGKRPLPSKPLFPEYGEAYVVNGYIAYVSDRFGTVYEHRIVAARMIGRPLKDNEVAHHKNHIRHDNREENIEIKTNSEHAAEHALERNPTPLRLTDQICRQCGNTFRSPFEQKTCSATCRGLSQRVAGRPTKEQLLEMRKALTKAQIAKIFSVSEAAVRKWLK